MIGFREFNELVNMTSPELEDWLKQGQSENSGWDKGDGSGETVGHERQVTDTYIRLVFQPTT